ncbi:MAG: hypothetical protein H0V96_07350 [Acidimicrobiia bacterium]|nr:hypothetical protein [Acidimicrobiia bacterium]
MGDVGGCHRLALRTIEVSMTDHLLGLELHRGLPTLPAQQRIAAAHRALGAEFGRIYAEGVAGGEFPADLAAALVGDAILATARTLMAIPDPKTQLHRVGEEFLRFLFNGLDAG